MSDEEIINEHLDKCTPAAPVAGAASSAELYSRNVFGVSDEAQALFDAVAAAPRLLSPAQVGIAARIAALDTRISALSAELTEIHTVEEEWMLEYHMSRTEIETYSDRRKALARVTEALVRQKLDLEKLREALKVRGPKPPRAERRSRSSRKRAREEPAQEPPEEEGAQGQNKRQKHEDQVTQPAATPEEHQSQGQTEVSDHAPPAPDDIKPKTGPVIVLGKRKRDEREDDLPPSKRMRVSARSSLPGDRAANPIVLE